MANSKRSVTSKQAWRMFENAVKDIYTIEEAALWLKKNPHVARKMTGAGLLDCFEEELKLKK